MFLGILLLLLLMSILLAVFNFQYNKNTLFLSGFLSLFALYGVTHYVVTVSQSVFWGAILYINLTPLYLLSGPLLYFYVRNTLADKFIFKRKDLLHFIPAILLLIGAIPYLTSTFEYKKEIISALYNDDSYALSFQGNVFITITQNFILRLSLISAYTIKGLQLLFSYRKKEYHKVLLPKRQKRITFRWLILLHILILSTVLSYAFFVAKITVNPQEFKSAINGGIIYGSAIFLGLIVLCLLLFPDILYGFPMREKKLIATAAQLPKNENNFKGGNLNSDKELDQKEAVYYKALAQNIINFFENSTDYLDPDFKMADLVKAMEVPHHHISYCLNRHLKQSLHQLKLSYRMQWSASALLDYTYNSMSIDAIGNKAGYQSKSAFFKAFKEHHGITPLEHQKLSYTSSEL